MKVMLYVVLDKGEATRQLLNQIVKDGYNGTLIRTKGIKHLTANDNSAYLSLSQIAENTDDASATVFFIVEESKLPTLEDDIRKGTDHFKKIHGGMFVLPVKDFEGSF
jgi:hypothetical protein